MTKTAKTPVFEIGKDVRLRKALREAFPEARTLSDAAEPIEVHVGARDRRKAIAHDPSNCAMALACKREYQADGVWVGLGTSYVLKGTHLIRYLTPDSVGREITTFDRHGDFATGAYRLSAVSPSLNHALKAERTSRSPRRRTDGSRPSKGTVIPRHYTTRIRSRQIVEAEDE